MSKKSTKMFSLVVIMMFVMSGIPAAAGDVETSGDIVIMNTHISTADLEPEWSKPGVTNDYNVTITNTDGDSIDEIRIMQNNLYTGFDCDEKTDWTLIFVNDFPDPELGIIDMCWYFTDDAHAIPDGDSEIFFFEATAPTEDPKTCKLKWKFETRDIADYWMWIYDTTNIDSEAPETTKTFIGPYKKEMIEGSLVEWIDGITTVELTAVDLSEECGIGVETTYYKNKLMEDVAREHGLPYDPEEPCWNPQICEELANPNIVDHIGPFDVYEGPFQKEGESCHVLWYYSVDELGNMENVKTNCFFVDKTPPIGTKEIGDPKISCNEPNGDNGGSCEGTPELGSCSPYTEEQCSAINNCEWIYEPNGVVDLGGINNGIGHCTGTPTSCNTIAKTYWPQAPEEKCLETKGCDWIVPEQDDCWWVRDDTLIEGTPITLSCEDQLPHPSGDAEVCYKVSFDLNPFDLTDRYCSEGLELIEQDGYLGNWCCVDDGAEIVFHEDSEHELEYFCRDAVDKKSDIDLELFKVDSQPPIITKEMIGTDHLGECPPGPNPQEPCYVRDDGQNGVSITVVDDQTYPECSVDEVECKYHLWWEASQDECDNAKGIEYSDGWCKLEMESFDESGIDVYFTEDSTHKLYINCKDALGNWIDDTEYFEVDSTPPETAKEYGEPQKVDPICKDMCASTYCFDAPEGPVFDDCMNDCTHSMCTWWITSQTPVTLTSEDEKVGKEYDDTIYWRNLYFPDNDEICQRELILKGDLGANHINPCNPDYYMQYVGDQDLTWNVYDGRPFYKPEESCHVIEYYSVDALGNDERFDGDVEIDPRYQCVFVDNSAPYTEKTIGVPQEDGTMIISTGVECPENNNGHISVAVVGDQVHQITPPVPGIDTYCSIGLAFDGTYLYYDRCGGDTNIYIVDPITGDLVDTFDTGVSAPNAMEYDATRGGIWFGLQSCDGTGMPIYFWDFSDDSVTLEFHVPFGLNNPATGQPFLSYCFTDGLAFNANDPDDPSDDEIWFSDDVNRNVGVFRPDGTFVQGYDATTIDSSLAQNSGLAIGGSNLYLGNNGGGDIFRANKDTMTLVDQFTSGDDRQEDMACDPITFAPTEVMWVRTTPQGGANPDVITAYEIESGTCGVGGEEPEPQCEEEIEVDMHWVTQNTLIDLECVDREPHPVQQETLCYKVSYDLDPDGYNTDEYCDTELNDEGYCCVYVGDERGDNYITINFREDSEHDLEYYCIDHLGNDERDYNLQNPPREGYLTEDGAWIQWYKVDTEAPVITKTIVGPQIECPEENSDFQCDGDLCNRVPKDCYQIDGVTEIHVDAIDPEPHPVDEVTCDWWYEVDGKGPYYVDSEGFAQNGIVKDVAIPFVINFPEESTHLLYLYCEDALQNSVEDVEMFIVDKTPPVTLKTYGQPRYPVEIKEDNLCYKDGDNKWQCYDELPDVLGDIGYTELPEGSLTYKESGPALEIIVQMSGLKPETEYQLTLNGRDGGDGNTKLANNCDNPDGPAQGYEYAWECGTWSGGTGDEGFWNFDMTATTDGDGNYDETYFLLMPDGHYGIGGIITFGVGFIVKEAADVPGGSNYPPVLMETNGLDWTIEPYSYPLWITSDTEVHLFATDAVGPHDSGVAATYWRNTLLESDDPCWDQDLCQQAEGSGEFNLYEGPFQKPEQSCHLIEYYSVDNVNKTEEVKKQCVFVDNSAPDPLKTVEEPKTKWDGNNSIFYPEETAHCWETYDNGTLTPEAIDCWKVTMDTPITMDCIDPEPHPVDHEETCFMVGLDGDDATESYCTEVGGSYNESGNGYCCGQNAPYEFTFMEESEHNLKYYCEDALGNIGPIDEEKFKVMGRLFEIQINKKWNLISVPFDPLDKDVEDVFKDIKDNINAVWTYDGETKQWYVYRPGEELTNNLEEIKTGYGYWVSAYEDDTLLVGGSLYKPGPNVPPNRELAEGWNLIGYYGAEDETVYDLPDGDGKQAYCALYSIVKTNLVPLWSSLLTYWEPWNPIPGPWVEYGIILNNALDPGAGYWIHLKEGGEYVPSTACVPLGP